MTPHSKQSRNYWAIVSFTVFSPWKYLCKSHHTWEEQAAVSPSKGVEPQAHRAPWLTWHSPPAPRGCRPATKLHQLCWLSNFQYFSGWQQQWCSVCQLLARQSRFSVPHLVVELCVQSACSHSQHSNWGLVGPWQGWYQVQGVLWQTHLCAKQFCTCDRNITLKCS